MKRESRGHDSDVFGRPTSGSLTGLDAPLIGAPSAIILDGIVERESGATPPPPAITLKMVAVALGVMLLLGLAAQVGYGALYGPRPLPVGSHAELWLEIGSRFEFSSEADENGEVKTWYARPGADTVFSVDGSEVTEAEFAKAFPDTGALRVSVKASTEGIIERVNAATAYRRTD